MDVWQLLDRPIAVHRPLVSLGLGMTGAVMLSQALYWTRRTGDDGWFYKTQAEWEDETGMTRREQETARSRLKTAGYMQEDLRGVPAMLHFKVDTAKLSADLLALPAKVHKSANPDAPNPPSRDGATRQTVVAKTAKLPGRKRANKSAPKRQTNITTETTTETTAETTHSFTPTADAVLRADVVDDQPKAPKPPIIVTTRTGSQLELPGDKGYPRDPQAKTFGAWATYASQYHKRYGVWPVSNARQTSLLSQLVDRVGKEDAPRVVHFYLNDMGDALVVKQAHPLTLLVNTAETWLARMQGAVAARSNQEAQRMANVQATGDSVAQAMAMREARNAR